MLADFWLQQRIGGRLDGRLVWFTQSKRVLGKLNPIVNWVMRRRRKGVCILGGERAATMGAASLLGE